MSVPKILQDIRDLKSSVLDIQNSQLVGRYYIPIVDKVSGGVDTVTASPLPTTWVGSDKSYTNGDYMIETTMLPSGANPFNQAFDGNLSTGFIGIATTSSENSITITLPEAIRVSSFNTYILDVLGLDYVYIYGSNDKINWSRLHTGGADTSSESLVTRSLSSVGDYRYYQFRFTVDSNASIDIREIQLNNYIVNLYINKFTIEGIPTLLTPYQRIMIKTPNYSNIGVTSNTLNDKEIDILLLPERYYELVYDGTKYLAKEVV